MPKNALLLTALWTFTAVSSAEEAKPASGADGTIARPADYRDFRLIAVSQRADDQTLRAILGNEVAIEAVRTGKTHPWPNGTILAKVSWKQKASTQFPAAILPGEFTSAAFMVKEDGKYAATGGWGWGEWIGLEQKPYDKPGFVQECVACHTSVKDQDWVFTRPVKLP